MEPVCTFVVIFITAVSWGEHRGKFDGFGSKERRHYPADLPIFGLLSVLLFSQYSIVDVYPNSGEVLVIFDFSVYRRLRRPLVMHF